MKQKARITDGSSIAYKRADGGRLPLPAQDCELEDTGNGSVKLWCKDQDGNKVELTISEGDYASYRSRKWLNLT